MTETGERHHTVSSECHRTAASSHYVAHRPGNKRHNVVVT